MAVWLWLPAFGPVRTSTVISAVLMLGVITAIRRDPLRAVAATVSWSAVFETAYHLVGIVGYHWPIANIVWMTAALAGWILLAAVLGVWPDWRISLLFVALIGLWVATGFHYNVPGQARPINIESEILNEAAKTTLAVAYLVGALRAKNENSVELSKERDRRADRGGQLHLDDVAHDQNDDKNSHRIRAGG